MSHWDSEQGKIIRRPPYPVKNYPGWVEEDCGCCVGLEWGGEEPRECHRCGGGGVIFLHLKSGTLAQYPGGPFYGRTILQEQAQQD